MYVKLVLNFILISVTSCVFKARSVQLKAVVISERVLGFDHPNTIQQYVSINTDLYDTVGTLPCGCSVINIVMFYKGLPGCVCVCWRGDCPGSEVSSQSSSANANSPWRRPSIHCNTGCRLQHLNNHLFLYV